MRASEPGSRAAARKKSLPVPDAEEAVPEPNMLPEPHVYDEPRGERAHPVAAHD